MKKNIYEMLNCSLEDNDIKEIISIIEKEIYDNQDEKQNVELYHWLLLCYLSIKEIRAACYTVAKYKVCVFDTMFKLINGPKALLERGMNTNTLVFNKIFDLMIELNISYEELFNYFLEYPSGLYAQILIEYARYNDRRSDVIALSNIMIKDLKNLAYKADQCVLYVGGYPITSDSVLLKFYSDRLSDLVYMKDYTEIKKCVNESYKWYKRERRLLETFDKHKLIRFWTNMMRCLNIIGRYDKTIEIGNDINYIIKSSEYYLYLAEAYYMNNNLSEAGKNAKRSAGLGISYANYLLLAQIRFTEKEYDIAEVLLWKCIDIISENPEEKYMTFSSDKLIEYKIERTLHDKEMQEKLQSPYSLLFLTYVYRQNYVKAKAFYEEMKEKLGSIDMVMISEALLDVNKKAEGQIKQIELAKEQMKYEMELINTENEKNRELLKRWTELLIDCQIPEDTITVTGDYWDENIKEKMENVIQNISDTLKRNNSDNYMIKEREVREKFPNMHENAIKFLASANQMYEAFSDNPIIDFAPVMVEYCKVYEVLIWCYFDETGEYNHEISINKNKLRTLGTATWAISQGGKEKSLYRYVKDMETINKWRCESAHKEKSKKTNVDDIKKWIWEGEQEHDLIKKLV